MPECAGQKKGDFTVSVYLFVVHRNVVGAEEGAREGQKGEGSEALMCT